MNGEWGGDAQDRLDSGFIGWPLKTYGSSVRRGEEGKQGKVLEKKEKDVRGILSGR